MKKPERIDCGQEEPRDCDECQNDVIGFNHAIDEYESFIKGTLPSVEEIDRIIHQYVVNNRVLDSELAPLIDKLYRQRLKVK